MSRVMVCVLLIQVAILPAWPQAAARDSTSIEIGNGSVTIRYGSPSLKGRTVDELVIPGFAWRMGMNEPTTLETSIDLEFYGRTLRSGKYVLFARPDENNDWTLIVSSQTSGSILDPSSVVFEAPLFLSRGETVQDVLKITLSKSSTISGSLDVSWGTYRLRGLFRPR